MVSSEVSDATWVEDTVLGGRFEDWGEDPVLAFSHANPAFVYLATFVLTGVLMVLWCCFRRCCCPRRRSKFDEDGVMDGASSMPLEGAENVLAYPAYGGGQDVEVYLKDQRKWVAAECNARMIRNNREAAKRDVVYTVTLPNPELVWGVSTAQQVGVPVDLLRDPFVQEEGVDVFSATKNEWVPGRIVQPREVTDGLVSYMVTYGSKPASNAAPIKMSALQLRRRYAPGAPVQVYLQLSQGWVSARVTSGAQWPIQDSRSPAKHYWKMVPIEVTEEGEEGLTASQAMSMSFSQKVGSLSIRRSLAGGVKKPAANFIRVPSYLLRPGGFFSVSPMQACEGDLGYTQNNQGNVAGSPPVAAAAPVQDHRPEIDGDAMSLAIDRRIEGQAGEQIVIIAPEAEDEPGDVAFANLGSAPQSASVNGGNISEDEQMPPTKPSALDGKFEKQHWWGGRQEVALNEWSNTINDV